MSESAESVGEDLGVGLPAGMSVPAEPAPYGADEKFTEVPGGHVRREATGEVIPPDPGNADRRRLDAWIEAGGVVAAAEEE